MSEAMLRLAGVEKAYNKGKANEVSVLSGIDLTIGAGEMVALVAPSGAGKSTLLHIAGLLDTADAGVVEIGGDVFPIALRNRHTEFGLAREMVVDTRCLDADLGRKIAEVQASVAMRHRRPLRCCEDRLLVVCLHRAASRSFSACQLADRC